MLSRIRSAIARRGRDLLGLLERLVLFMTAQHLVDSAVCILVPCRLGGEPDQVGAKGFLQGEAHPTPGWLWYLVSPTGGTMVTKGGAGKSTTPGGRIMVRGKEKLQKRETLRDDQLGNSLFPKVSQTSQDQL